MLQPAQQFSLVASRVSPEITLLDALGQRGKSQLGTVKRFLLGSHIAVSKLIGHYQIRFGPDRDHRLIASPLIIMSQRGLLVTFDNRGVLVHGGQVHRLSLLRVELGDPPHHASLDRLQALDGQTAGQDESLLHLTSRAGLGQFFVMKAAQETSYGADLGNLKPQTPFQAGVAAEQSSRMSSGQSPPAVW